MQGLAFPGVYLVHRWKIQSLQLWWVWQSIQYAKSLWVQVYHNLMTVQKLTMNMITLLIIGPYCNTNINTKPCVIDSTFCLHFPLLHLLVILLCAPVLYYCLISLPNYTLNHSYKSYQTFVPLISKSFPVFSWIFWFFPKFNIYNIWYHKYKNCSYFKFIINSFIYPLLASLWQGQQACS